jgi:hypothetical protein
VDLLSSSDDDAAKDAAHAPHAADADMEADVDSDDSAASDPYDSFDLECAHKCVIVTHVA